MLRQLFVFVFALSALNASANTANLVDPFDEIIALEIEIAELELELFGSAANGVDIVEIEDIVLYEVEEEIELDFDTTEYLPEDFNARKGMHDIDWSTIELYELEEELDLGFDTSKYLPKNFNPYRGMDCESYATLTYNHR